jgi:hypothetical protein
MKDPVRRTHSASAGPAAYPAHLAYVPARPRPRRVALRERTVRQDADHRRSYAGTVRLRGHATRPVVRAVVRGGCPGRPSEAVVRGEAVTRDTTHREPVTGAAVVRG